MAFFDKLLDLRPKPKAPEPTLEYCITVANYFAMQLHLSHTLSCQDTAEHESGLISSYTKTGPKIVIGLDLDAIVVGDFARSTRKPNILEATLAYEISHISLGHLSDELTIEQKKTADVRAAHLLGEVAIINWLNYIYDYAYRAKNTIEMEHIRDRIKKLKASLADKGHPYTY